MKRVVITGATGFIGANLARRLLEEGHEIHLLVRSNYSRWRIDSIRDVVKIHIVDINDSDSLKPCIFSIRPDWVFHLAAYGAYSSQSDSNQIIETNLAATVNLVDACTDIGFDAFVYAGTSSEYGLKDHAPSENELLEPNSIYGISKAAATHYCLHVAQSRKASITSLRLYSVYGAFEEPTRLIPALIVQGLKGHLPPLVNPSISRDYIEIRDALDAFIMAASSPAIASGKIYNIGTGVQTSLSEVVDIALGALPIKDKPEWGTMPNRKWDTATWVADHTRITKDLGWQPSISLRDGFTNTVDWIKSTPGILDFYQNNLVPPR